MKLILSRKGFDSSAGGCPSPILPDGRLCSLPIPDRQSLLHYRDLTVNGINAGELVADLTGHPERADDTAHLDPDLDPDTCVREQGWRGLLGQDGTAQSHLRNQQVGDGDLFLFFGLFRPAEKLAGHWRFVKSEPARHVIWGWLQAGAVHAIPELERSDLPWARYHPHFAGVRGRQNTLYEASDKLSLGDLPCNRLRSQRPGFGTFRHFAPELQLTALESRSPSLWRLPAAFFPVSADRALTYHQKLERWQLAGDHCDLRAAARGQEFVLDLDYYPGVSNWLSVLFTSNRLHQ